MFSLPMSPETEILKMNRPGAIAPGPQRRLHRLAAAAAPPLPGRGKTAQHGEMTARTMEPPSRGGSPDCRTGPTASSCRGTPNGSTWHRSPRRRPGGRERTRRQRPTDQSGLNSPVRSDTSPNTIHIRYRACHKAPTDSAGSCRLWQCQRMCHHPLKKLIRHYTCIARPRTY